ncbi:MAG: hypothetical protein UHD09_03925 [Bifidobacterium sp.]|nr:hypothetical protein [Bifidobacterium sp.]
MRNTIAVCRRILQQFRHDPRTLALLFVAPIIVLWLLSVLLNADSYVPTVATVKLPTEYQQALEKEDVHIKNVSEAEAERLIDNDEVDAVLRMVGSTSSTSGPRARTPRRRAPSRRSPARRSPRCRRPPPRT